MVVENNNKAIQRYSNWSTTHSAQLSSMHLKMLSIRLHELKNLSKTIEGRISDGHPENYCSSYLYDRKWLNEFATGDIVAALGSEFSIYKNRRSPRIPNGDLLMMTGIRTIQGNRGDFSHPSVINVDYKVPVDAWFLESSPNGEIPLSLLLEIGLQPCGVLSAWLGTQLKLPQIDFFFRNLDGEVLLHRNMDTRGKIINTQAVLINTVLSGTTIIQHFEFELSIDGSIIFSGKSSFGYFPEDTMVSQSGLDGGKASQPWAMNIKNNARVSVKSQKEIKSNPNPNLPSGKLLLIDNLYVDITGGEFGLGYAMSEKLNNPEDWFYKNHFFQDPVMPGSLGIEATMQLLATVITANTKSNQPVSLVPGIPIKWKYRGQVLQKNEVMRAEAHIVSRKSQNKKTEFIANANVWADNLRIYEISNLSLMQ